MTIGKGSMCPITRKIQEEFFALTSGKKADRHNWLTHVNTPVAAVR
jgi:branched-chain amino acid aminotransferase